MGTRNALSGGCRCGRTRDLYNGRIGYFFLYLKFRVMNRSTLWAILQFFSVRFCHLRFLVLIPRSRCWTVVGSYWLDVWAGLQLLSCWLAYSCVRYASQNIHQHWNSLATCLQTQQVNWYLAVVPLCHRGFYLSAIICKFRHFSDNIGI